MKFFIGAILLALLALGVLATLRMPRPEARDEQY